LDSLEAYDPKNQSMVFEEWYMLSLFEYASNKILATVPSTDLFLIQDFNLVKMISNHSYIDTAKLAAVPLLDFDEDKFPFLLLCGCHCLSIMNVKTGDHKPLIDDVFVALNKITPCFVKREEYGLALHWTTISPNIDGSTQEGLVLYSFMAIK